MIRFVYSHELHNFPVLEDTMFRDRATQFRDRMKWDVTVDDRGWERDQYDELAPLYLIYENADGTHAGSGRMMPTIGRTMIAEHFTDLTDDVAIRSPTIWEITRFCMSPKITSARESMKISSSLLLAGQDLGMRFGATDFVAVFDEPMVRIYGMLGVPPTVLGSRGEGRGRICAGIWPCSDEIRSAIEAKFERHESVAPAVRELEMHVA